MSYLIDTNVLSELRRKQPDPAVVAWMQARPRASLYLSVLTLVTRNTKDFAGLDLQLVNPWSA